MGPSLQLFSKLGVCSLFRGPCSDIREQTPPRRCHGGLAWLCSLWELEFSSSRLVQGCASQRRPWNRPNGARDAVWDVAKGFAATKIPHLHTPLTAFLSFNSKPRHFCTIIRSVKVGSEHRLSASASLWAP
eukprot:Amastigsp_a339872_160.p2 type:complete len:131 gc:universal Amastigsp_a339872_160:1533-1141(-)